MDAPDLQRTLIDLLDAGTPTRVEEVLDEAGIRLERSGAAPVEIEAFWRQLYEEVDRSPLKERSYLAFRKMVTYARASIKAREGT